uniref:Neurotransmitter-gated ion-channel ligand-binding domain-containing protein n=1 Tax=Globodera rostochiensis TaxID=31243 RepID=A0A914I3L2_GLORO
MGVSPASAVSTAMNLFSILTLPMGPKELDQDMAKINSQMHDLVPKLFVGYDRTVPPSAKNGGPVEIQSLLVVDHIEELNDFEQTLNFHGTLMMMWRDERLIWEAEDFGQLGSLAFTGFDLTRFWWPDIVIKGITMPSRQILMFHNGIYTLKSSGLIIAELSVSIKAACRIDLKNYPYDNQTCFIFLFTPAYPAARVTFTTSSAMYSKESLQGSIGFSEQSVNEDRSNILNTTMAGF